MDKQNNNQIITMSILILIPILIAFSIMLYKTYKTKRTQNISYYLLSFLLLIETIALYMLLRNHNVLQMSFTTSIAIATIIATIIALIATIYFIIGTLYILYIKQLYADEETIEKRLEEKDIINISKIEDIC